MSYELIVLFPSRICFVLCLLGVLASPVWAQDASSTPPTTQEPSETSGAPSATKQATLTPIPDDVKIVEQLGAKVSQSLVFTDEEGKQRPLAAFLDGKQPVILVPVYYSCPLLCNITLNRLVGTLQSLPWSPGTGYRIVTFTIDSRENSELAKSKKAAYLKELARPGAESGWHFLTSSADVIRRLTDSVGFGYRYDQQRLEYLHHAALILLSPDGQVTQYLRGSYTPPIQLKIGLLKAADGSLGTLKERMWASIFTFDAERRKFVLDSTLIGIILAFMLVVPLGLSIVILRRRPSS